MIPTQAASTSVSTDSAKSSKSPVAARSASAKSEKSGASSSVESSVASIAGQKTEKPEPKKEVADASLIRKQVRELAAENLAAAKLQSDPRKLEKAQAQYDFVNIYSLRVTEDGIEAPEETTIAYAAYCEILENGSDEDVAKAKEEFAVAIEDDQYSPRTVWIKQAQKMFLRKVMEFQDRLSAIIRGSGD